MMDPAAFFALVLVVFSVTLWNCIELAEWVITK